MKKLMAFAITILLSLTSFSQIDTQDSIVCLPIGTARLVAADLLEYDKCKLVLIETQELLRLSEQKNIKLDSTVVLYDSMIVTYKGEISTLNTKFGVCDERVGELETENVDLKIKNERLKRVSWGLGSGLAAMLGAFLLSISIK